MLQCVVLKIKVHKISEFWLGLLGVMSFCYDTAGGLWPGGSIIVLP